jgi:hypothetical protein
MSINWIAAGRALGVAFAIVALIWASIELMKPEKRT